MGDYYLQSETVNLYALSFTKIGNSGQRFWFVEDMNVSELAPDKHEWLKRNTRLVANLDVHVEARNFVMRVYLYESEGPDSGGNAQPRSAQKEN
jgi:hypothetical protein